jgi:hypothetical protein
MWDPIDTTYTELIFDGFSVVFKVAEFRRT